MKKILGIFIVLLMLISTVSVIGNITDNDDKCQECMSTNLNYPVMTDIPPKSENALKIMDNDPQPTMSFDDLPSQFNWANYGGNWMTPVKDQAYPVYCGSCYIFGTWASFEAAINIASGYPTTDIILSEQYGLSCINGGCNGCGGGWGSTMLENIVSTAPGSYGNGINGVPIESCMPYTATDSIPCSNKCADWDYHNDPPQADDKLWQIESWGWTSSFSEKDPDDWNTIKTWLIDKGPLAVSMAWDNGIQNFVDTHHSPNDVYEQDSSDWTNHIIALCGWVDDPDILNGGYWILKNSHGTAQGYGGYCNLAYGCNQLACSECNWVIAEEWPEEEKGPGPVDADMAVFADFDFEPAYPHLNEEVDFTDKSQGEVVLHEWDFNGDGIIDSNQKNPTWTYNQEGECTVSLRVWSGWGLSNTRTKDVEVKEIWPPKAICQPENYPEEPGDNDLEIHFDGRYSYDRDGGIITNYHWNFGDGTNADGPYLYHTFPEADTIYEVTLTVTDNDGGSEPTVCTVKIDQTVPPETEILHGFGSFNSDWYSSTQKISFLATDWTKVIDTFYRIDNGNWKRYVASQQQFIPVSVEGMHTVEAYSVDYYGNKETPVSDVFGIDKTAPSIDVTITGKDKIGEMYIPPVDVRLQGEDDLSGIEQLRYCFNDESWEDYTEKLTIEEGGIITIESQAIDNAGNTVEETYILDIDSPPSAPEITGSSRVKPNEENEFTFSSSDTNSEDQIYYYINWGDGDIEDWIGPHENNEKIRLSHIYEEEGSCTIKVKARDNFGAESKESTFDITASKIKARSIIKYPYLWDILERFSLIKEIMSLLIGLNLD